MKKSIVVIMAHADDIELGAGGTLAKYIADGYRALYGVLSRCNSGWTRSKEEGDRFLPSREIVPIRRREAEAAAELFGAELYYGDLLEKYHTTADGTRIVPSFAGAQTTDGQPIDTDDVPQGTLMAVAASAGGLSDVSPVTREITDLLVAWEPELVIGQEIGNLNIDHLAAAQILAMAWRLAREKADIGPLWLPVPRPQTDASVFPVFEPNRFVDVSQYEDTARAALACHKSQGGHLPVMQDPAAKRRRFWGENQKVAAAEAFVEVYP